MSQSLPFGAGGGGSAGGGNPPYPTSPQKQGGREVSPGSTHPDGLTPDLTPPQRDGQHDMNRKPFKGI
jgi:hypothetical protein